MPRNGFINFVAAKQRSNPEWKDLSMQELVPLCDPMWRELQDYEKKRFQKVKTFTNTTGKDSYGRDLEEIARQNEKERTDPQDMTTRIMEYLDKVKLEDAVFIAVHTNILTKTDSGEYVPAEICVAAFNLRQGIIEIYHDFPDPQPIPMGYKYDCMSTAERTHKIPMDLAYFNPNFHTIISTIQTIMDKYDKWGENAFLFTDNKLRKQTHGVLDRIYNRAKNFRGEDYMTFPCEVLDIATLMQTIMNLVSVNPSPLLSSQHCIMEKILKGETYIWDRISCQFHADDGRHCSKALVRSWIYNFCAEVCPLLKIDLVKGRHIPPSVSALEDLVEVDDSSSVISDADESLFEVGVDTDDMSSESDASEVMKFDRRNLIHRNLFAEAKFTEDKGPEGAHVNCGADGVNAPLWSDKVEQQRGPLSRCMDTSETDTVSETGSTRMKELFHRLKSRNTTKVNSPQVSSVTSMKPAATADRPYSQHVSAADISSDSIASHVSSIRLSSANTSFATADGRTLSDAGMSSSRLASFMGKYYMAQKKM